MPRSLQFFHLYGLSNLIRDVFPLPFGSRSCPLPFSQAGHAQLPEHPELTAAHRATFTTSVAGVGFGLPCLVLGCPFFFCLGFAQPRRQEGRKRRRGTAAQPQNKERNSTTHKKGRRQHHPTGERNRIQLLGRALFFFSGRMGCNTVFAPLATLGTSISLDSKPPFPKSVSLSVLQEVKRVHTCVHKMCTACVGENWFESGGPFLFSSFVLFFVC